MFEQLKEDMDIIHDNKVLNEIRKSIQDMKIEFIKEIELLKKTQTVSLVFSSAIEF